jgi:prepilin-type processing-associated H-X9-DG protein
MAAARTVMGSSASVEGLLKAFAYYKVSFTLANLREKVDGNRATVRVNVTIRQTNSAPPVGTTEDSLDLRTTPYGWQIVPGSPTEQEFGTRKAFLSSMAAALGNHKWFDKLRTQAVSASCVFNVRQLCTGALMFAEGHRQRFSFPQGDYKAALGKTMRVPELSRCPIETPAPALYRFNVSLIGKSTDDVHRPADTVMFYEGSNAKLDFRHGGLATVGFVDGHVKQVNAEAAQRLIWEP